LILMSASGLVAQDQKPLFPFKPLDAELSKTMISKYFEQKKSQTFFQAAPNGRKLVAPEFLVLPLDNMPCKLLDASFFNMPVKKLKATGTIPMAR
jgi:hypothetical protein